MSGSLAPGERINEPDVASRLQISRVPVREALRELESSGVVVSRKHSGVFVRRLEAKEVLDLYQMRALLDGFAGRTAAQLPKAQSAALVKLLTASAKRMEQAMQAQQSQAYYAENLHFHWAIVEAAGNLAMSETYRSIVQKLHISRLKNLSAKVGMKASIAEHRAIVKALHAGDSALAEGLMSRHVADAFLRLQLTPSETTSP
jgi:DNA-binding GntR family transcriptional regulator